MNLVRIVTRLCQFSIKVYRTQTFQHLSDKYLATPELVKRLLIKRIPYHSPISQVSLYHGKRARHAIKSCFSEKKTNRIKKVNKLKKIFYSEILGVKIHVRLSKKAYRCILKMGSFDKYILLTSPKNLDSKIGEYYRTLMMRKINDPTYRIPYIIGSGKKQRIHKYKRYLWIKETNKFIVPKNYREKLTTYQRKFGTNVDQFNEEDYQKYLEVEKMKKLWGRDVDTKHPLLLEIQSKMEIPLTDQEIGAMEEKAQQFRQAYLNSKNRQQREQLLQYNEREGHKEHLRVKEAWLKHMNNDSQQSIEEP